MGHVVLITSRCLTLTVVQSDEEDPLDHVVDVELLAELLSWAERSADLCHRVIIFIDAVRHRIFWLRLALSWIYSCRDKQLQIAIKLMLSCKFNGRAVLITKTLHCCSAWCRCFWPDANCFASAREPKSAANGFLEMFWLLLPWSVISLEHVLHQQVYL